MKQILKLGLLVILLVAVSFVYKLLGGKIDPINRALADAVSAGGGGGGNPNDGTADNGCGNDPDPGGGGGDGGGGSDGSDGSCC